MRYTWIPFYKEFAEKLLNYRNDRASLLSLIYENSYWPNICMTIKAWMIC